MLAKTEGVEVCTPGRGNIEAAKPGEQEKANLQMKKID
jgi:hypothetical protein